MINNTHQVVTRDFPENILNGIMVCGINFGYSKDDERSELVSGENKSEAPSFFSDAAVNDTRFRNRLLFWLKNWGIDLAICAGEDGPLERSFFQTNWLNSQTRSVTSDTAITCNLLVQEADGFLSLLSERRPKTIILVGAKLIEALNDMRLRERVEAILGARSGNAEIHRASLPNVPTKQFKVLTQSFGNVRVVCLPHPQSRGLRDDYMASFKPIILRSLESSMSKT